MQRKFICYTKQSGLLMFVLIMLVTVGPFQLCSFCVPYVSSINSSGLGCTYLYNQSGTLEKPATSSYISVICECTYYALILHLHSMTFYDGIF